MGSKVQILFIMEAVMSKLYLGLGRVSQFFRGNIAVKSKE